MKPLSRRTFLHGIGSWLALPLLRLEEPELILYNGNIWTVDETQPQAQALAISDGRFLAVGSNEDVLRLATARTRKIDLAWKTVLPGFNDAHAHPVESGVEHLRKLACDKDSIEQIKALLHERAKGTPPGEWVLGFLYDDGKTPRPINRHDLDDAVKRSSGTGAASWRAHCVREFQSAGSSKGDRPDAGPIWGTFRA